MSPFSCFKIHSFTNQTPNIILSPRTQRTEFPLACELVLRLTSELPEFKLRLQVLEPEGDDDHQLPFEPTLLRDPEVLRLPAGANQKKLTNSLKVTTYSSYIRMNIRHYSPAQKRRVTGLNGRTPK